MVGRYAGSTQPPSISVSIPLCSASHQEQDASKWLKAPGQFPSSSPQGHGSSQKTMPYRSLAPRQARAMAPTKSIGCHNNKRKKKNRQVKTKSCALSSTHMASFGAKPDAMKMSPWRFEQKLLAELKAKVLPTYRKEPGYKQQQVHRLLPPCGGDCIHVNKIGQMIFVERCKVDVCRKSCRLLF